MKPVNFEYIQATDFKHALVALASANGEGKILAGGQSLMPMLNMRLARPKVLVDINEIPELNMITNVGGNIRIGATVRHRDAERSELVSEYLPLLAKVMPQVAHTQIRNRGTLVGSIVHADPSAEVPLAAILLDATLEVHNLVGERIIPISDFFFGYMMTDLQADEIVTSVTFPNVLLQTDHFRGTSFIEMARRDGDFALVSAACQMDLNESGFILDIRLGIGGVGGMPVRLNDAEDYLKGKKPSTELFLEVAEPLEDILEPDDEPMMSADYRRQVAVTLIKRVLQNSWDEAVLNMSNKKGESL